MFPFPTHPQPRRVTWTSASCHISTGSAALGTDGWLSMEVVWDWRSGLPKRVWCFEILRFLMDQPDTVSSAQIQKTENNRKALSYFFKARPPFIYYWETSKNPRRTSLIWKIDLFDMDITMRYSHLLSLAVSIERPLLVLQNDAKLLYILRLV